MSGTKRVDRRGFLKTASAVAAVGAIGRLPGLEPVLFAAPRKRARTLVSIYLRGGADPLNMLVPHGDPLYYDYRPEIAVAPKDSADERGVIRLDDTFGLNPALAGWSDLWDKGQLAPIICVGSDHPTRSHFDAQDFMEYAAPGSRTMKDGWLNRYLAATEKTSKSGLRGVGMQKLLPRSLRGAYPVLAVPDGRGGDLDDGVLDVFEDLYGGKKADEGDMAGDVRPEDRDAAVQVGRDTIRTLRQLDAILDGAPQPAADVRYPRSGMATRLARLASVIKADAGLEVACLDFGGWDTHTGQGGASGSMARRMVELSESLGAFMRDLGQNADDVLVLVMTEFGRTCRENGNQGTDHGHGSVMFAMGGQVQGGRVHGKWSGLDEKRLYEGRDLPVTTDFRAVFHESLTRFLEYKVPKEFFPDYDAPRSLKLLA